MKSVGAVKTKCDFKGFKNEVKKMELIDIKGIDAILEQAGIYSVVSEQLADNLQDFKKQIEKQKSTGDYDEILTLLSDAESLMYRASFKLSEIEAKGE